MEINVNMKQITYVTGLWNLDREGRNFEEWYLPAFKQLLALNMNLVVYGAPELEPIVWETRNRDNTVFYTMSLDDIKGYYGPHWDKTQEIRTNPEWVAQAAWMQNSPQYRLEYYNPIVMSKYPMLNDVAIRNPFGSKYFYWIDAGLTRTVDYNLLNSGVLDRTGREPFLFLTYPHEVDTEIHGFERTKMAEYCDVDFVRYVCRGGFFGGNKYMINLMNKAYYDLVRDTIHHGYMGTEESIFTIMHHRNPDMITAFNLGGGGIQPYFEHLRDKPSANRTHLYVLTYNTPKQVEELFKSFQTYDEAFLTDPKIFIIDNSDDPNVEAEYQELCERYRCKRIKLDNVGITGGREHVSRHFAESDADFYWYFEDDMLLGKSGDTTPDPNGFSRWFPELYDTVQTIMRAEKYDFLKLNFQEVFASNTTNTAWHNSPADMRTEAWPDTKMGPPLTKFDHIKSMNGVPYAEGDVFYANWPHIMSRRGNQVIFIENTYVAPAEWYLMAHAYKQWMDGKLKCSVLLGSPVQHQRIHDYDRTKRKEF